MTSRDLRWPKEIRKWRHLSGSHLEEAVEGRKQAYTVRLTSYKAWLAGRGSHVTGNDVTKPQVNGSDPEVTSLDRKSPGSGCRRPKICVYCAFDFLQTCSSQEAVTRQDMTSHDLRCPEEIRKWRHLSGSHLAVAVEGRKLAYSVRLTSYKAVARRRRQSRDTKWRHVTSGDRKWLGSDVIDRKSHGSTCRRQKTGIHCAFDFLHGCSSQEEAVTWQKITSHDQGTGSARKWRYLTGSNVEVALEGRNLPYTVRLNAY